MERSRGVAGEVPAATAAAPARRLLASRFLWKLYAGYALLILLATGTVGTLVVRRVEAEARRGIERRLTAEARLLREVAAPVLAGADPHALAARIVALGEEVGTRLTVIAADGVVVADSVADPAVMENHGDRPEVLEARARGVGSAERWSRTLGRRMCYVALVVSRDAQPIGYVRTSLPLDRVGESVAGVRRLVATGAGVAALVALGVGLVVARRVTRPIASMTAAAQSIAAGDYGRKVRIRSRDELGDLARAFNDMSLKLAETLANLSADRNKLTAVLASMEEGVVAIDRDERVLHMNAVAGRFLGARPEEVRGRPIWEVTRLRDISETLSEAMRGEMVVHRVVEVAGAAGQVLELRASPLRTGGGQVAGAVEVIDNVTQLRRLETVRQDFVANVSHELKTPVTAIRGLVETLLDDPDIDPATARRFLDKLSVQAERLSALVIDLLSLSRLESEDEALALEPVDLRQPVRDSVRALQSNAEVQGVRIESELPQAPVPVLGDVEALREAVANLLDNAIKYTRPAGTVWVRLRGDGAEAIVEVEDRGPGIEPQHQERIFERFYRVDRARSRELGGTGLGLAIVKHIALAHRGRVSVESRPGAGSTFRIHLPSAQPEA